MGVGERLNGIQEVCGSIPHISTKKRSDFIGNQISFCVSPEPSGQSGCKKIAVEQMFLSKKRGLLSEKPRDFKGKILLHYCNLRAKPLY